MGLGSAKLANPNPNPDPDPDPNPNPNPNPNPKVAGAIGSLQPAAAIIDDMMRQATQVMMRRRYREI